MSRSAPSLAISENPRFLIVQLRAMGDMLLATPLFRTLKRRYPDCTLHILSAPLPSQVLRHNTNINQVWIAPPRGTAPTAYAPLVRQLRRQRYNVAIDLLCTPGSALLTRLTGAATRIGYRLRGRSWAYTHLVPRRAEPAYNPLTKFDLVKILDISPDDLHLDITVTETESSLARQTWLQLGFVNDDCVIALAPWSKRAWRRWTLDNWLDFLERITASQGVKFLLFASESERLELQPLLERFPGIILWAGAADLKIAAALMQKCARFLGVDNGLKHIAVAVGIPTLTIFTGSDPLVWNPPGQPCHVACDLRQLAPDDSVMAIASAWTHWRRQTESGEAIGVSIKDSLTGGRI